MPNEELIAALEAADGPSRELDAEIFLLQWPGYRIQTDCDPFPEQVQPGRIQEVGGMGWRNSPAYTSSIDAALTLAKEGQASDVLCDAIVLLNVTGWKGSWRNALPRFIVIAALKAMEAANAQG